MFSNSLVTGINNTCQFPQQKPGGEVLFSREITQPKDAPKLFPYFTIASLYKGILEIESFGARVQIASSSCLISNTCVWLRTSGRQINVFFCFLF